MSVLHTRIRNHCSDLNFHLYLNHFKDNVSCSCGYQIENAEHYFFHCPRYTDQRIQLFRDLHILHPLKLFILVYGSNKQYDDVNKHTFVSVHGFIRNSKRFDRRHSQAVFVTLFLAKLTYPSPVRQSNSSIFSYVCIQILFIFHFIYQSVHIYNNRTNYNRLMHSNYLYI